MMAYADAEFSLSPLVTCLPQAIYLVESIHVYLFKPYHVASYSKAPSNEPGLESGIPFYKVAKILSIRVRR